MGARGAGMGTGEGAGDGMREDPAGVSGRGTADDGRAVFQAGVSVRIRGFGERSIRPHVGGAGDYGRGGTAVDRMKGGGGRLHRRGAETRRRTEKAEDRSQETREGHRTKARSEEHTSELQSL